MKRNWLIASTLCLSGCLSNNALQYDAVATNNMYHIAKVRKGMSEKEVLFIMRKPYRYETFELGEDVYDVWFYVTQTTVLGQSRMVPQNLTPLSFKNGVLVGTGYDYYYYIVREDAAQQAAQQPKPAPTPPPPIREPKPAPIPQQTSKPPQPENTELEQSLEKAAKPTKPPTEQPGNLQKVDQPTAPILSYSSPVASKPVQTSQITKGMTQDQVKKAIGKPADKKVLQLGDDVYEVWFYDTSAQKGAKNAPLTFKNGILVGMTDEYYEGLRQAAGDPHVNGYDKEGEKLEEGEIEQDFNSW